MDIRTIRFGDEGQLATGELLRRFEGLAGARPELATAPLARYLRTFEAIDRQYGGEAPLPLEDADELVSAALAELARLESDLRREEAREGLADIADLTVGVALWALRHDVEIRTVEPIVNALALRSNRAGNKQELAAVFGLMQGVIAHVSPGLRADLERSNPERPWRLLHANLAITAIRTEDPQLMAFAFDALDAALPDERAGFYSEALALAMGPRIPAAVRKVIEARHGKWNLP